MMSSVKRWLKDFFYSTGNARLLDRMIYNWSKFTHSAKNNRYKKNNPEVPLPPAYFLYETYMPDYERYMEDGKVAAQEIIDWTLPYLPMNPIMIMECGCGVARIVRHLPWILEMHRILVPRGIFLFTTHGKNYHQQLIANELKQLTRDGYFTRSYPDKGHRMMTTYNDAEKFRTMLSACFDILEFHDGQSEHDKTGGQDLWILRKR